MTDNEDKSRDVEADEPEPTEQELREARALGDSLDRVLSGDKPQDELSATALLVQASAPNLHLEPRRRDALVNQALTEAGQLRRTRTMRRIAPVVVALAASFLLVITGLLFTLPTRQGEAPAASTAAPQVVSAQTLSRPSNDLVGHAFKDRAGASRRLDTVFADRMRGYRLVMLAERGQP